MQGTYWARKQKLIYTISALAVVILLASIFSFKAFYKAPTCFDGKKNGKETGVDCGGNCERICEFEVAPISIKWEKFFRIRQGEYSAVAYIENTNSNVGVERLGYKFNFLNDKGEVIKSVDGETYVPAGSHFPIFEGPIRLPTDPVKVEFLIDGEVVFTRSSRKSIPLRVENTTLMSSETRPKLSALLSNDSVDTLDHIDVVAIVMSSAGDPVAASRTALRKMGRDGSERIVFTWPEAFREELETCSKPSSSVLAIDRSGSMQFDSKDPPQPLTDALSAAQVFVRNLTAQDKIGVVSYGTESSLDIGISNDKGVALETIKNISIPKHDEFGYTNIGSAIKEAHEEIKKDGILEEGRSVIILLTDGMANAPEDPGGEVYAEAQAESAKRDGVVIYTIGLGDEVNRDSLIKMATEPSYYFEAVTASDLAGIYEEIGSAVCSYGPSMIEIVPRYNNVSAHR